MAITYHTRLYKATLTDFELGWQIAVDEILFASKEYADVRDAMRELDFHTPSNNNWFATMIERINEEVTDEEIFDSSVVDTEYKSLN